MPKRKYTRLINANETEAEYNKLRAKYPDCVEPDWRNCWVRVESTEDCRCGHAQEKHTLNYFPSSYNCVLCDCQQFRKLETITALVEFDWPDRVFVSPLNPNEQAAISVAGQSALQNGDLGVVASALDGIAAGREGLRRSRVLSKDVGKRQLFADQRRVEREQAKNDRLAVQAERQAILKENSAIRKQINTLQRDLVRGDIRGSGRKEEAKEQIERLTELLLTNEVQVEELDKELRQLSGKKSFSKQGTQPEPGKKRLGKLNTDKPSTAEDFLRKRRGSR